jgi:hypothetical protein
VYSPHNEGSLRSSKQLPCVEQQAAGLSVPPCGFHGKGKNGLQLVGQSTGLLGMAQKLSRVQVRLGKWLTDLEKNFYGSSLAYDKVRHLLIML